MKSRTKSWVELSARIGYAAKGIVYITVGTLATLAALNQGGETTSSKGALETIAQQPFGQILLCIVAIGLVGYALWRLVQAGLDPEHKNSTSMKSIIRRVGYAVNGVIYAGVAFTAFQLLMGSRSSGQDNGNSAQVWTAKIMSQPFGQWLVGTCGALMIGLGIYYFYRAFSSKFRKKLKLQEMSELEQTWATRIGVIGISARGVVFVVIGAFLIQAARQANPSEVRSSEGALEALQQNQTTGPLLFIFVAIGLVAYGIHMLVQARYRRIQPK